MKKTDPQYIHYARANLLRELAEKLPTIIPEHDPSEVDFLNRLADEELEQAEYDAWVRAKIAAVDVENTRTFTPDEVEREMDLFVERLYGQNV